MLSSSIPTPRATVALDLHFANSFPTDSSRDKRPPLFLAGDGIRGSVSVRRNVRNLRDGVSPSALAPGRDGDTVVFCLVGELAVKVPGNETFYRQPRAAAAAARNQQRLNKTVLRVERTIHAPGPGVSSAPFTISIPTTTPLIPSMHIARTTSSATSTSAETTSANVTYTLEASYLRNGDCLGTTTQEIRLYDQTQPPPPSYQGRGLNYPIARRSGPLKRKLFSRARSGTRGAFVSVTIATEPEACAFTARAGEEMATTALPLRFEVNEKREKGTGLGGMTASVVWRLKTMTAMATKAEDVDGSRGPTSIISSSGLRHESNVKLDGWLDAEPPAYEAVDPSSSSSSRASSLTPTLSSSSSSSLSSSLSTSTTTTTTTSTTSSSSSSSFLSTTPTRRKTAANISIPISLPRQALLPPTTTETTTATPYLSHRYALEVQVSVRQGGNGRRATLSPMEVPLQILYRGGRGGAGGGDGGGGLDLDSTAGWKRELLRLLDVDEGAAGEEMMMMPGEQEVQSPHQHQHQQPPPVYVI